MHHITLGHSLPPPPPQPPLKYNLTYPFKKSQGTSILLYLWLKGPSFSEASTHP